MLGYRAAAEDFRLVKVKFIGYNYFAKLINYKFYNGWTNLYSKLFVGNNIHPE